jgi:hypothetical protein
MRRVIFLLGMWDLALIRIDGSTHLQRNLKVLRRFKSHEGDEKHIKCNQLVETYWCHSFLRRSL